MLDQAPENNMPIDTYLRGALNQAMTKKKTMNFALAEKKTGEGTLIVHEKPISPSKIAEAEKDIGATKTYKGTCVMDEKTGELVFESTTSVAPAVTLQKVIKLDAGLTPKIASRKAGAPPLVKAITGMMGAEFKAEATKRLDGIQGGADFKKTQAKGGFLGA